jgi:MFS family permease
VDPISAVRGSASGEEGHFGEAEWRSGWRVVLASLFGIAFGVTGLFFYSTGIFLKPVAGEFGWSRAAASTVPLIAALALAITAPFVGAVVDRVGTRIIAIVSSAGLALGFWLLSHSAAHLGTYLGLVVVAVLLGSGASPVVYTRLINLHFRRSRGAALGIAQTATGIAGALIPALLIPYVGLHGWRAGYRALALCAIASLPITLLLLGRLPAPVAHDSRGQAPAGLTLADSMHKSVFYLLVAMLALAAVGVGGIIVHLAPMLSDAGMSPARAGAVASALGFGVIIGRVSTGYLVDRLFAPRVAFLAFILAAGGCVLLAYAHADRAVAATVLVGLAMGAEVDLISYLVARYFGLVAYGRIYGLLYAVFMVGTSMGPIMAGAAFDRFGNYHLAAMGMGACLALASLLSWGLPRFPLPVAAR